MEAQRPAEEAAGGLSVLPAPFHGGPWREWEAFALYEEKKEAMGKINTVRAVV